MAAAGSIVANWIAAKTPGLSYGLRDSVFSAAGNGGKFGNESEFRRASCHTGSDYWPRDMAHATGRLSRLTKVAVA